MTLPLSRAALVRVIPFAVFMALLAVRGVVPEDGSWGHRPALDLRRHGGGGGRVAGVVVGASTAN